MKMYQKNIICLLAVILSVSTLYGQSRAYYQIKVYHITKAQESKVDDFLKTAYVPAIHRAGIKNVGVFKPIAQDTADLKVYVFVPFNSLDQFDKLNQALTNDLQYKSAGKEYLEAAYNDIPYKRIESILLRAFPNMPQPEMPKLTAPKNERVYELRSYESATENLGATKIKQFNVGGEIQIFKDLNFNAVFYAEVIAGPRMPNLMYMTTFNSKVDRDAKWVSFTSAPAWKTLSAITEYKNTVSKQDIILTTPADYSDY